MQENLLEPFLRMEREIRVVKCVSGQIVRNAGMPVGKRLPFAGILGRISISIFREKILPAAALGFSRLCPEPVDHVEIRSKGGRKPGVQPTRTAARLSASSFRIQAVRLVNSIIIIRRRERMIWT